MKTFPGKMVVLEGIDGCGKTTIGRHLAEVLPNGMFLASPSWAGTGAHIREILTGERKHPGPWTLQMLFAVDRYEIEQSVLIPALEEGKTVLCDRWWYSGVAYGAYDKLGRQEIVTLYQRLETTPDLVIHLKVDPEVSVTREGKGAGTDLYDGDLARQKALAANYDQFLRTIVAFDFTRRGGMAEIARHGFLVIDANRGLDEVRGDVLKAIQET